MSLSTSISKTQQYLAIKATQADNDEAWRQRLIKQLSHILDDATLQQMPLWQLRQWTAPVKEQPKVDAKDLIKRVDAMKQWFDKACPVEAVEVEPVQPVVEIDQEAMAAFRSMCQNMYSDRMNGVVAEDFEGADQTDFDENEVYSYRTVA